VLPASSIRSSALLAAAIGAAVFGFVRSYAVLQWDKEGFDFAKTKPDVGERFDSRWGPSIVVERSDDPTTGTYLLLRIFPHGYEGKPSEIGIERHDTPRELVGKV